MRVTGNLSRSAEGYDQMILRFRLEMSSHRRAAAARSRHGRGSGEVALQPFDRSQNAPTLNELRKPDGIVLCRRFLLVCRCLEIRDVLLSSGNC